MSAAICPAPGCCSPVAAGKFLCRPHWFALPKRLREQINRTWRAYKAARSEQAARRSEALLDYRSARDEAIAYLAAPEVAE